MPVSLLVMKAPSSDQVLLMLNPKPSTNPTLLHKNHANAAGRASLLILTSHSPACLTGSHSLRHCLLLRESLRLRCSNLRYHLLCLLWHSITSLSPFLSSIYCLLTPPSRRLDLFANCRGSFSLFKSLGYLCLIPCRVLFGMPMSKQKQRSAVRRCRRLHRVLETTLFWGVEVNAISRDKYK